MLIKKARSGGRLASPSASPTISALVQEIQPTPSPLPVTPPSTDSAVPSATATLVPSANPSQQPVPTSISTSETPAQVSPASNTYCRKGPGMYYDAVTYLQAGSSYQVVGRDGLDAWWQIQFTPDVRCWEGDPAGVLEGPVELAPLLLAPPLPDSPSFFSKTSHCDPDLNTMTVWLTWEVASGANGYRLYRNDEKIAELGEKTSSYTELAPRFVDLNYRLEAFNEYGIAPDLSLTISACR
jgi:hypothetical protein